MAIGVWVCRGCSMRRLLRFRGRSGMRLRLRGVGVGFVVVLGMNSVGTGRRRARMMWRCTSLVEWRGAFAIVSCL